MEKQEREQLKKKIEELIQKQENEIQELKTHVKPVSPENSIGRVSRMDAINNKSVMEAALRNKEQKLSKLKIARSRIDLEGFGVCSNCKRSIQPARLLFMPESSKCVYCAGR